MAMLDRYRKKGGFVQLLNLIETCGIAKQEKFLKLVEEEDLRWANALKSKIITIERILSWDDTSLSDIIARLPDLTIAVVLHGLDPDSAEKIRSKFSDGQSRRIEDLFETNNPSQGDLNAMFMKIIVEVRDLIRGGYLKLEKVDPELIISDDMEEMLNSSPVLLGGPLTSAGSSGKPGLQKREDKSKTIAATPNLGTPLQSVRILQLKVEQLTKENHELREELALLKQGPNRQGKIA